MKLYQVIDETFMDPDSQYVVGVWINKENAEKWIEKAIEEDEILYFTIHELETKD